MFIYTDNAYFIFIASNFKCYDIFIYNIFFILKARKSLTLFFKISHLCYLFFKIDCKSRVENSEKELTIRVI